MGRILQTLQGKNSPRPVPGEFSGELFFDNIVSASFLLFVPHHHQQWVHISGDKGYALVQDYVLPYHAPEVSFEVSNNEFLIDGCDFHMEKHTRVEAVYEYPSGRKPSQEVIIPSLQRSVPDEDNAIFRGQDDSRYTGAFSMLFGNPPNKARPCSRSRNHWKDVPATLALERNHHERRKHTTANAPTTSPHVG